MGKKGKGFVSERQRKYVMRLLNPPTGKASSKYISPLDSGSYNLKDIEEIIRQIDKIIEDNPEFFKKALERIAIWGGCTLLPEICPILNSVYLLYKEGRYGINIDEIFSDGKFFYKIFKGDIKHDTIQGNSPSTVILLARKAQYGHRILENLINIGYSNDDIETIEYQLLLVLLKMDNEAFLTNDELTDNLLRITESYIIEENKLLDVFEETLKENDIELYKKLILGVLRNSTEEEFNNYLNSS